VLNQPLEFLTPPDSEARNMLKTTAKPLRRQKRQFEPDLRGRDWFLEAFGVL